MTRYKNFYANLLIFKIYDDDEDGKEKKEI